ncbi:MAG TPA: ribonuclease P [Candidatus Nanoarchaeia archaeon]|nr:ribonuclease P [Candidatus Nanoarchaeia archaeon]
MSKPIISKEKQKDIAKERIEQLFDQAERNKTRASRYVNLARKISMKTKIRIPAKYKRRFCKYCFSYLIAENSRVRTRKGKVIISCLECKKFMRIPIKK